MSRGPVLLVEDDHDIRVSVRQTLEDHGYQVYTAANGQQAIELLRKLKIQPQLVVLDLLMPVMDGWQFVELLRSTQALAALPVVVQTAYPDMPPPQGIDGVLAKPVDLDVLVDLADRYCRAA
jgi:CheY-like chemotaxis protein